MLRIHIVIYSNIKVTVGSNPVKSFHDTSKTIIQDIWLLSCRDFPKNTCFFSLESDSSREISFNFPVFFVPLFLKGDRHLTFQPVVAIFLF